MKGVEDILKNYLVTQRNELVEAYHVDPLSVNEQKVILTMISMIEPNDTELKSYQLKVKDFADLVGLQGESIYSEIKKLSKTLVSKVIELPIDEKDWLVTTWVSSVRYKSKEGTIELSFEPRLKPYLVQLKEQFTSYKLSNVLSLNSSYSIRLYELMKRWQFRKEWTCSIDELRKNLGTNHAKSYLVYGNFKSRVLLPAILELNEKTDIKISFNEIKRGRRVELIKFRIEQDKDKKIETPDFKVKKENSKRNPENEDIRIRLNELADKGSYRFDKIYFSEMYEGAYSIWQEKSEAELEALINYVNAEKSIKNPLGFIKSKLQSAWKDYLKGEVPTFFDLEVTENRTGKRKEIVPKWFKDRNNHIENNNSGQDNSDIEARREKLRDSLRKMGRKSKKD